MKTSLVLVMCKDLAEARKIARSLLKERLVACANLLPGVESHFWWQSKLQRSNEVFLMLKTKAAAIKKVSARIRQLHSYECPGIEVLEVEQLNPSFSKWLDQELKDR